MSEVSEVKGGPMLQGMWPGIVGHALECAQCRSILDCTRAVQVSATPTKNPEGVFVPVDVMYCVKCYDEKIKDLVYNGRIRKAVALDMNLPLWAPPPDPKTLPLPGVLSEEQPPGTVRVQVEVYDGRTIMPPADDSPAPVDDDGEVYVTWKGEKFLAPSMDELARMMLDGVCESLDGYRVEPDGYSPAGYPSWLIAMGLY
tara:strand:+ start:7384 stop:7983 length:600 start_codon:yes stop_codon:yes gene_type:complete